MRQLPDLNLLGRDAVKQLGISVATLLKQSKDSYRVEQCLRN